MKARTIAPYLTAVLALACAREPALVRQTEKVRLIHAIRTGLLESVEAEKSAVLATTDEESRALAREAERSAANIDELVGKLRRFVTADARPEEIGKLEAFEAAWAEVADVDMRLLALAVANTNLKAVRLSAGDGAAALDRFVDALTEMQNATSDLEVVRQLSAGAISALRVQSVLLVHIPSADDAEMTDVERRMNEWSESVERILGSLRDKGQPSPEMLGRASLAWGEYRKITAEVLRLSRQNTNVISFDVSVHEKRRVTQACLSALSELLTAVGSVPRATR